MKPESHKNACPGESYRQVGSKDPGRYVTQVQRTEGAMRTWGVGGAKAFLEESRMRWENHGLV